MKYSLKNEYKKLLNEEIVSVIRSSNYAEEIYDVNFDPSTGKIISGEKFEPTQNTADRTYRKIFDESLIAQQFTIESRLKIISFLNKLMRPDATGSYKGYGILQPCPSNPIEIVDRLNRHFRETIEWRPSNKIGRGEVSIRLAFSSKINNLKEGEDASNYREPDFIGWNERNQQTIKLSIKSFVSIKKQGADQAGTVRTGTNLDPLIIDILEKLSKEVFNGTEYTSVWNPKNKIITNQKTGINHKAFREIVNHYTENDSVTNKLQKLNKIKIYLQNIKRQIIKEHGAVGIIAIKKNKTFDYISPDQFDRISIYTFNGKRFFFYMPEDDSEAGRSSWELELNDMIIEQENLLSQTDQIPTENSSYVPQGKVLKEVYSYLFKKKLISEGGLAGHMMHPYEALDMTPRQIIDRIKEYSNSQKIIEKVDGQNLFFTVEKDGTLMFARNKEDMTHNDLVEKFTNHPAEVPFVTGGNAIKKGVDQWLSSAGAFGSQEILDIFHPDGEARSFINFEIMHKDHPNQLEYGENFIVFHSIVDFINGREAVYSSNNSQRLNKLINLMKPGIESSGYTLASNRTVDINKLTNVQITHYVDRIKEIANRLDITETEFLGDGVEKQIKKQLDAEGIDISDEAIKILYDFALYGEDRLGNKIKSKDFTRLMKSDDVKKLRDINLTSANKAAAKVRNILSPFKDIFVDLGIDLLDGTPSAYMDSETDLRNIDNLRDKLETAIDDLRMYMNSTPENEWDSVVTRLKPHYDKVVEVGVYNTISTSVEGGVYDYQGDLLKVTGGFAPMNQILGAAYRDKKGIFTTFKQKFMHQESNRRSLKSVFSSIF
jgi:hypothetical protein